MTEAFGFGHPPLYPEVRTSYCLGDALLFCMVMKQEYGGFGRLN